MVLVAISEYGQKQKREKTTKFVGFDHHLVKLLDSLKLAATFTKIAKAEFASGLGDVNEIANRKWPYAR